MHLVIEADDAAHGHQLDEAVVQGVHLQQRVRVGLHERCNNGSSSSNSSSSSSSSSSRVRGVDSGSVYCKQSGVLTVGRRIANTNTYLTQTKKITRTIRTRTGRQERCNDGGSSSSSSRSLDVGSECCIANTAHNNGDGDGDKNDQEDDRDTCWAQWALQERFVAQCMCVIDTAVMTTATQMAMIMTRVSDHRNV